VLGSRSIVTRYLGFGLSAQFSPCGNGTLDYDEDLFFFEIYYDEDLDVLESGQNKEHIPPF
jgi:hypothetical protein